MGLKQILFRCLRALLFGRFSILRPGRVIPLDPLPKSDEKGEPKGLVPRGSGDKDGYQHS